ncbi:hypothetical protein FRB98_008748 [Tulasnella sp. 332]|nr:hypothetical protein FRB98_008748 [Tulasnella sp. 332]
MNFLQYPAGIAVNVIIIWRLFVICSRERRMIYFPMMLQCSGFMASVIIIRDDIIDVKQITHSSRFLNGYHDHRLALLAINITIMWYCTGLICYRLWSMEQQKRAIVAEPCQLGSELGSTNPYAKIIRALIRSGVLYCLSQVACLVCLAMQNDNGELILHELYIRVIGIVTVLIFLELDFRRVDEDPMAGQQLSPPDVSTVSMPVFRVPTPVDSDVEVGIKPQPSRVDSDSTVAKVTEGSVGS